MQANGLVERHNRTVLNCLLKLVKRVAGGKRDDWVNYVPCIVNAINSHKHRSTRRTPFECVFGWTPMTMLQKHFEILHEEGNPSR